MLLSWFGDSDQGFGIDELCVLYPVKAGLGTVLISIYEGWKSPLSRLSIPFGIAVIPFFFKIVTLCRLLFFYFISLLYKLFSLYCSCNMRPSLLLSVAAAVAAHHSQPLNLVQRDPTARPITHADLVAVAESMPLEKRISEDFDLGHQLLDKTLFNGNLVSAGTPAKVLGLKVTCKECSTKGTITARLTTENIVKPVVRFEFKGVEATANMDVVASGTLAFTLNLFTSQTPLGISVPGLKLGLLFSVDLAFSLSDSVDLAGGFHMKLPDDAFFELDVFDGDIQDKLL